MTWTVRSFGGDRPRQTIGWPRCRSRVSVTPSYSPTLTSLPPEIDVFPLENLFISIDYIFFVFGQNFITARLGYFLLDHTFLCYYLFGLCCLYLLYLGDAYSEIASAGCRPSSRCRKTERDPGIILNKVNKVSIFCWLYWDFIK